MSLFGENIESFSKQHPGGCYNLSLAANGTDDEAIMLFVSSHTGRNLKKISQISKMHNFNIPDCCFEFSSLKQEIHEIFVNAQRKHSMHGFYYKIYSFAILMIFLFCIVYNIFSCCLLNMLVMGLCWVSYAFVVFHTRLHLGGNLFVRNNNFERKMLDLLDNIVAASAKNWIYRHQLSHHLYTNSSYDNDVMKPYPFLRLVDKAYCEYKPFHKYQWFYGLVVFALNGFTFPIENITQDFNFRPSTTNKINATDGSWIFFVIYLMLFVFLPTYFNGLVSLVMFVIVQFCASTVISILFQVSHHQIENKHDNDDERTIKDYDLWIKAQIEESMSWGGYLATLIFGGINFQIEHHVAPCVLPIYYYFAYPDLQRLCNRYQIQYSYHNNLLDAYLGYHKYICTINQPKLKYI